MSVPKTTCGPLYRALLHHFCAAPGSLGGAGGLDTDKVALFAAGFCCGQAEKVYLGACTAAMFRPSAERRAMLLEVLAHVCAVYGLLVVERQDEVWVCRDQETKTNVMLMDFGTPNSPAWHRSRGDLCGVPDDEIDEAFHERQGYGERCD